MSQRSGLMQNKKAIKWLILGSVGLVALIGFGYQHLGLVAWSLAIPEASKRAFRSLPFDSQAWKRADVSSLERIRYRMHEDLLKRYPLIGMSKENLIELLGPPVNSEYFREWDLKYPMGPEPGIGIDFIWLVLKLRDDTVIAYNVVTD